MNNAIPDRASMITTIPLSFVLLLISLKNIDELNIFCCQIRWFLYIPSNHLGKYLLSSLIKKGKRRTRGRRIPFIRLPLLCLIERGTQIALFGFFRSKMANFEHWTIKKKQYEANKLWNYICYKHDHLKMLFSHVWAPYIP